MGKNDAEKSEVCVFVSCSGKFFREKETNARSDLYIIQILSARRRMMGDRRWK